MEVFIRIAEIYLLFFNLLAFTLFGIDKNKAIRNAYRIPEKTLFLVAILGGSLGAFLGMRLYHHKTRRTSFRIGIPVILCLHLILVLLLFLWLSSPAPLAISSFFD